VQVCFYCSAALALSCWCRLSSNVRPQNTSMLKSLVGSVLSSTKQRQRFIWFRLVISLVAAFWVSAYFSGLVALGLGVAAFPIAYMTVAPVLAFSICLVEGILS
jgi:hypothetical protein